MRLERISISGHDREMAHTPTLGCSCVFLCSQRSDGARKDVLRNINGARICAEERGWVPEGAKISEARRRNWILDKAVLTFLLVVTA